MPVRQIQRRKLRKISVGDMRDCVSLEERGIKSPTFDSVGFSEGYTQTAKVFAKVETEFNARVFDGVSIDEKPSHKFTIRFRDDVTNETRVRWKGVLYRLVRTDDYEGREEYLELYGMIDGDETKEAAQ
tara:strand:+ start:781 stop:1167 length:387 start_codon:yes stop_codon:yes gene_type:complete